MFIHFWERGRETERQSASGEGAEREGDPESKAGPDSELSAQSPTQGLNSRPLMNWAEVGRLTDWATQAPWEYFYSF